MINIFDSVIDGYKDVRADKIIGIFGHPIKHTLSPVIHDNLSDYLSLDERYIPFDIDPSMDMTECVNAAYKEGVLGLNITVPYKQEVMKSLADIDESAKAIGAVNTLVRVDGGYKGYNTDMPGLARAILSEGIELLKKKVIMLGAGGAARAVAYMCMKYGAGRVYILNRTLENAKKLADDMNREFNCDSMIPVAASDYNTIPKDEYLFIQCTSVGLHEGDGLPLVDDKDFYSMATAGVDLIYNPAKTPFILLLEELGIKAFNGLKMLLYQGIMAYEMWNDVKITDEACEIIYNKLCEALYQKDNSCDNQKDNIVLVGYMGAGKTSVGKRVAKKLGYEFIDTDEYIVKKEGMSINDIFANKGETYFRQLETDCLIEIKEKVKKAVLSTGGGLPLRDVNARLLKEIGRVYYLKADADVIYDRIKDNSDRPLLKCDDPYKRICDMIEERNPRYEACSDIVIDTRSLDLKEITDRICSD